MSDLDLAIALAREAGAQVMRIYAQEHIGFTLKSPDQELTQADTDANAIILAGLRSTGHPIISEETPFTSITDAKTWVVDPLDGTKGFIKRTGDFCVMIGMLSAKRPVLGVVYVPLTDTLYYAQQGGGAWVEDGNGKRPLRVVPATARPRIIVSKEHSDDRYAQIAAALGGTYVQRGSIGLKLCAIAAGDADIYYNLDGLSIWDLCAPQAILEEAGGALCDLDGRAFVYDQERFTDGIIAAGGHGSQVIGAVRAVMRTSRQSDGHKA